MSACIHGLVSGLKWFHAMQNAPSDEQCAKRARHTSPQVLPSHALIFSGPPHRQELFRTLDGKCLGVGSTSEVFEWVCCSDVQCDDDAPCARNGWFQSYGSIETGEHVAVKCFAFSKECIGSSSAGPQPLNYPTKLTTGTKEREVGERLAAGSGPGKAHVNLLLASWMDRAGLWLVFRLVPAANRLDQLVTPASSFCAQTLDKAAQLFRQFVLALQYLHCQGVVHRDGGLPNWLLSGDEDPKVVLIDFGLALCNDGLYTEPDAAKYLFQHLCMDESIVSSNSWYQEVLGLTSGDDLLMGRLNPIDWGYGPGAAGPKFPPPPELRVLREELPSTAAAALKEQDRRVPYGSGYDVWVLGWTFMQIMLGERWHDWKSPENDDPLAQHVRASFFHKDLLVEVPWELGPDPPAWRLSVLASGEEEFRRRFLDEFLEHISRRILTKGLEMVTPLQAAFVRPGSVLRPMLLRMIDFDPAKRAEYLSSGALLKDLGELEQEHCAIR